MTDTSRPAKSGAGKSARRKDAVGTAGREGDANVQPTAFALTTLAATDEAKIRKLIKKAAN